MAIDIEKKLSTFICEMPLQNKNRECIPGATLERNMVYHIYR